MNSPDWYLGRIALTPDNHLVEIIRLDPPNGHFSWAALVEYVGQGTRDYFQLCDLQILEGVADKYQQAQALKLEWRFGLPTDVNVFYQKMEAIAELIEQRWHFLTPEQQDFCKKLALDLALS
ncbi:MAG TPA: hypothetical protein VK184_12375 [Nostocaceae cyanobacterium]|nr:hypothetical protein [Nostocaceae cyanobacterium]